MPCPRCPLPARAHVPRCWECWMLMAKSQGTGRFIPASARVTCAQRPTFISRQDQHEEEIRAPELPLGLGEERGGGGASSAETSPPSPASLPPFPLHAPPQLITCKDSPSPRALLLGSPTYNDSHLQIPKGYDFLSHLHFCSRSS